MKRILSIFSIAAVMAACNSTPRTGVDTFVVSPSTQKPATETVDTTGLADFQAWKAQNELKDASEYNQGAALATVAAAPAATAAKSYTPARKASKSYTSTSKRSSVASRGGSGNYEGGSMSSESSNTAKRKKGWSKAAKGAVIGGVVGAGTGAVVNKRNRAVGAVIGGVLGGGIGYGIGRGMDKRDGRY